MSICCLLYRNPFCSGKKKNSNTCLQMQSFCTKFQKVVYSCLLLKTNAVEGNPAYCMERSGIFSQMLTNTAIMYSLGRKVLLRHVFKAIYKFCLVIKREGFSKAVHILCNLSSLRSLPVVLCTV